MLALWLLALQQDPWEFRVESELWQTTPKFRIRDGEATLKGDNVFSSDIDGDEPEVGGLGALVLRWNDELFRAEYWRLEVEGDGNLPHDTAWGGTVRPAGTVTDYDILHWHAEIGYRHRFRPAEDVVRIDVGLDVQYLVFDADMGFGTTRLNGLYWTPEVDLAVRALDWLELWGHLGGLQVATVKSEMAVLEPFSVALGLRLVFGTVEIESGWRMDHVHIEENMGDVHEDIVHLRLRSWLFGLNLGF